MPYPDIPLGQEPVICDNIILIDLGELCDHLANDLLSLGAPV